MDLSVSVCTPQLVEQFLLDDVDVMEYTPALPGRVAHGAPVLNRHPVVPQEAVEPAGQEDQGEGVSLPPGSVPQGIT